MAIYELHALVEVSEPNSKDVKRIVRTYESKTRADIDMELLNNEVPDKHYAVLTVEHVEA